MDKNTPLSTSTPNQFNYGVIKRRRQIHDQPDTPISPIDMDSELRHNVNVSPDRCTTSSNEDTDDEELSSDNEKYVNERRSPHKEVLKNISSNYSKNEHFDGSFVLSSICMVTAITFGFILLLYFGISKSSDIETGNPPLNITYLKSIFPSQDADTWYSVQSGINEVKVFNKPSVFLLLYKEGSESTVNNFLSNVSSYTNCVLKKNCESTHIDLTVEDLNSTEAINDYGFVIAKYKPLLEQQTIMIVRDLDKVSAEVAQAFHSFCDEFSPAVRKSVFFFTIKVENFQKRNTELVESILRQNWHILKDDIFYPLFTRISSIVLKIEREL